MWNRHSRNKMFIIYIYKKATTNEIHNDQKQQAYHTATELYITEQNREAPNKLNKIVEGR